MEQSTANGSAAASNSKLAQLIEKEKKSKIKWGYLWAIIGAIMWGTMYLPGVAVWKIPDFTDPVFPKGTAGILATVVVIAIGSGVVKSIITLGFWDLGESKLSDVPKAIKHWKISRVMLFTTLLASPLGVGGYQLATGLVGGSFAAASSLLAGAFAGIGATLLFKEKMSKKAAIGITAIIIGGIFIFNPAGLINDINSSGGGIASILGYIGGFFAALTWGLEGVFVSRVSDFYDYAMSMTLRAVFDLFLWVFFCLPLALLAFGTDTIFGIMAHIYVHPAFWLWEVLYVCGFSAYVGMYRSFPLIGSGRGMSVSSLYVIPGFLSLYFFMGEAIGWWIILGTVIAIAGTLYMYSESGESLADGTRVVEDDELTTALA
ncbi:MAG: hypothetical protein PHW56_08980 [Methanosarcinaceae archaeon]|nr:hypothetical protein [Methanosarcinaceae archaeon]